MRLPACAAGDDAIAALADRDTNPCPDRQHLRHRPGETNAASGELLPRSAAPRTSDRYRHGAPQPVREDSGFLTVQTNHGLGLLPQRVAPARAQPLTATWIAPVNRSEVHAQGQGRGQLRWTSCTI